MHYLWVSLASMFGAACGYAIGGLWTFSRSRRALERIQLRIERRQQVLDTAIGMFRAEVQRAVELEVKRNQDV